MAASVYVLYGVQENDYTYVLSTIAHLCFLRLHRWEREALIAHM